MSSLSILDQEKLIALSAEIKLCKLCRGLDLHCECRMRYTHAANIIHARIPPKYRDFDFKDLKADGIGANIKKLQKYVKYIDDNRKAGLGIFLSGNAGAGKTTLACIVLKEAIKHNYPAYFTTVEEYRTAIFDQDFDLVERIHNSVFLLIDDMGREFKDSKNFIESKLDDMVRYRTDYLLPTIITSNLDDKNVNQSRRLQSILKEHFLKLSFKNTDFRSELEEKSNEEFKKRKD